MKFHLITIIIVVLCQIWLAKGEAENDEYREKESSKICCNPYVKVAVAGAVGAAAVAATPVVLSAVGFGAAGVAVGSAAAAIQGYIGSVGAGSAFAAFQSAGAAGLGSVASTIIGGVGGLLGTSVCKCDKTI